MHVVIAGGTGLVGTALTEELLKAGHRVTILTRDRDRDAAQQQINGDVRYVEWLSGQQPEKELEHVDAIINLAGASISKRWTEKHKRDMMQSRLRATRECIRIMRSLDKQPSIFMSASAVGYYGNSFSRTFTEESEPASDNFLQELSARWEKAAQEAEALPVRTVYLRFGLILDPYEGALPKMMLPYQFWFGGPIGLGMQWYSWVHLQDVVRFILFALDSEKAEGVYNVTAPKPERMRVFGKKLSQVMERPHWFPVPVLLIRAVLGEMSLLVTDGQKVIPEKAKEAGFEFHYPELSEALVEILK